MVEEWKIIIMNWIKMFSHVPIKDWLLGIIIYSHWYHINLDYVILLLSSSSEFV